MAHYLDSYRSIPEAFTRIAANLSDRNVYAQGVCTPGSDAREWRSTTYRTMQERVRRIAAVLHARGVRAGDRVAIMSNSRPEWLEADLAILTLGGVTVSIYQSLPAHDVGYILFDSGAEFVFAENQEQVDKLLKLLAEPCEIPATEDRAATNVRIVIRGIFTFEGVSPNPLVTLLDEIEGGSVSAPVVPDVPESITRDSLASLVYTSGTTGPPKGVMQTHGNHLANVRQAFEAELFRNESVLMIFLPLAHSFARLIGWIGVLTPAVLRFPTVVDRMTSRADPASLARDIRESGATMVPVVPRLLEKMAEGIQERTLGKGFQPWVLGQMVSAAREVFQAGLERRGAPLRARTIHALTGGLRRKVRTALFGPAFECAISGGAKLALDTGEFFAALGIEVLEGYGLTETCVATNVNRRGRNRLGTVGPLLAKDIELRFGPDGEIIFRGPNVTRGYYQRPTATRAAWDEAGWFHTGDLGELDFEGNLRIVGRKKELIVTAGGKKVVPDNIEQKLKASPYISQAVLLGEGKPYCVAIVTINRESVGAWARGLGITLDAELHRDQRVLDLIRQEVERVNGSLASFETVKNVSIAPEEFTVDNGILTPTFKIKRREISLRFQAEIESMY